MSLLWESVVLKSNNSGFNARPGHYSPLNLTTDIVSVQYVFFVRVQRQQSERPSLAAPPSRYIADVVQDTLHLEEKRKDIKKK